MDSISFLHRGSMRYLKLFTLSPNGNSSKLASYHVRTAPFLDYFSKLMMPRLKTSFSSLQVKKRQGIQYLNVDISVLSSSNILSSSSQSIVVSPTFSTFSPFSRTSMLKYLITSAVFYHNHYDQYHHHYHHLSSHLSSSLPPSTRGVFIRTEQLRYHSHGNPVTFSESIEEFANKDVKQEKVTQLEVFKEVVRHLWPKERWDLRLYVVASLGCVLTAKVLNIAVPYLFKTIVDLFTSINATSGGAITASSAAATMGPFTLGIFAMVTAFGITRAVAVFTDEAKTAIFAPVGGTASTNVAMELFDKLQCLDLKYYLNRQTGVLAKDIDRGSRAFWSLSYTLVFMVVPTIVEMSLVAVVLQTQVGTMITATAFCAVVFYIVWTYIITNWRAKYRDIYNAQESKVGGMTIDIFINYETVKYFSKEKHEHDRVEKETKLMNSNLVKLDQLMALLNLGQQLIFAIAVTVSLYFSTAGVLASTMTVGDLVLVNALLMQLYTPLSFLGMLYRELQANTQNMQGMLKLKRQPVLIKDGLDAKPFEYKNGTFELRNVSFAYTKNGRPVLQNVSLTIPGGKTVAFVGPSGSGKSTIFRLLFRFFDPTEGEILCDGQPLKSIQMNSFRSYIGAVPQDTVLFNDTIAYNIGYGRDGPVTQKMIEKIARKACIHEQVTQFSQGYNTVVGERGLKLSGGEKQRIAIARIIMREAHIILADEATSALDTITERHIMETLKEATKKMNPTMVIIAHRLTTVKDADVIFVLDRVGQLAEQGTHEELLAINGIYKKLWNQQHKRLFHNQPQKEKKNSNEWEVKNVVSIEQ